MGRTAQSSSVDSYLPLFGIFHMLSLCLRVCLGEAEGFVSLTLSFWLWLGSCRRGQ